MLTLFYIFAAISIICAFGVLFMRNPIHCALMLVGTFFCLGGIYVMLNAEFVAVIQVLVYAGAIMVLFLFVLMLLSTNEPSQVAVKWDAAKMLAVIEGDRGVKPVDHAAKAPNGSNASRAAVLSSSLASVS